MISDPERTDFALRIMAACKLRGWFKPDLVAAYVAAGEALGQAVPLPASDIDKWFRKESSFEELHEVKREALCRALAVKDEWFLLPLDEIRHARTDPLERLKDDPPQPSPNPRGKEQTADATPTLPAKVARKKRAQP